MGLSAFVTRTTKWQEMSNKRYLSRREIGERYGRTTRTIARWTADPPNGFPAPVKIAGRDAWLEDHIEKWERDLASAANKHEDVASCS